MSGYRFSSRLLSIFPNLIIVIINVFLLIDGQANHQIFQLLAHGLRSTGIGTDENKSTFMS